MGHDQMLGLRTQCLVDFDIDFTHYSYCNIIKYNQIYTTQTIHKDGMGSFVQLQVECSCCVPYSQKIYRYVHITYVSHKSYMKMITGWVSPDTVVPILHIKEYTVKSCKEHTCLSYCATSKCARTHTRMHIQVVINLYIGKASDLLNVCGT